jgi:predicted O-methyltransferase YrrM
MDDLAHLNPPAALPAILARTEALAFSMPSEPRTGAMLRVLAASKPGGRLLELGTGTGISTAWLLDGMDRSARPVSVDVDPELQAVAPENLGGDARLQIVTADAAVFLRQQPTAAFDLIFADAMIGKYEILDEALALLRPGGLYVIDDMLPQANWPEEHAPRVPRLVADLAARAEFRIVSLAWSSGLVVLARQTDPDTMSAEQETTHGRRNRTAGAVRLPRPRRDDHV